MICLIVGCRPIIYWLIIVVNERELKKRAMFHNIPSIRRCPSPYIFMYTEEPACCIQYWHGESEKKRGQRFSKRGQLRHFIGHFPCRLLNCNIAYLHIPTNSRWTLGATILIVGTGQILFPGIDILFMNFRDSGLFAMERACWRGAWESNVFIFVR
jgi:hypothetical protein